MKRILLVILSLFIFFHHNANICMESNDCLSKNRSIDVLLLMGKRLQHDNFSDLVKNNAAFLRGLFAKGQHEYRSDLRIAESVIQQGLNQPKFNKILDVECDASAIEFVYQIARKNDYCENLISGIQNHVDYEEVRFFLQSNRYVINHYFTCPESGYEITPLHYVVAQSAKDKYCDDLLAYTSILLEVGANSNAADNFGDTPLHKVKNIKCMELLLKFGAHPNQKNIFGFTPLISYVRNGNDGGAELLIQTGVDLDSQDSDGNTALHYAINKANNDRIVDMLLQHGARFDVLNKKGQTAFCMPLGMCVRQNVEPYVQSVLCRALQNNDYNGVATILKRYSWISYVIGGGTIIAWAKQHCVQGGKTLKSVKTFERHLIQQLCFADDKESARLIEAGTPVDIPGYDNQLPLEWAIQCNNKEKIKILLEHGAKVTQEMIEKVKDIDMRKFLKNRYDEQH